MAYQTEKVPLQLNIMFADLKFKQIDEGFVAMSEAKASFTLDDLYFLLVLMMVNLLICDRKVFGDVQSVKTEVVLDPLLLVLFLLSCRLPNLLIGSLLVSLFLMVEVVWF